MRNLMLVLCISAFCGSAVAADKANLLMFPVDNKPALAMHLLDDWKAKAHPGKTDLEPEKFEVHVQLWNVASAKNVIEAMPLVPYLIKGEVTAFKAVSTDDIEVAGAKAKHIIGTGTEADDGDPSNAEVFLFDVGGKVFLICAHGEGGGAAKARPSIMQMLATAKMP